MPEPCKERVIWVQSQVKSQLVFICFEFMGFPSSSAGKESTCSAEDPGLILGQEDPLEKG